MQFDLFGALRLADLSLETIDRLAFLRDAAPHRVVLGRDGALLESSGPADDRVLRPLRMICADLTERNGQHMRYVVRSAMHKEVRRSDVAAAVRWARVMQLIDGPAAVRQYARRILFEETRDIALALSWRGRRGLSPEQMVRAVAAAPKKWSLPARRDARCAALRLLMYPPALQSPAITPGEIDRLIGAPDLSLSAALQLQWRVVLTAEAAVQTHLREALRRRVSTGSDDQLAALSTGSEAHLEDVLLEHLCGLADPTASTPLAGADVAVSDHILTLPPLRPYVYDPHTRPGRQRLVRHLRSLAPGVPMPPGLDLRWSGMARGAAWRASASEDLSVPWESVPIAAALWEAATQADALYYGSLYRDAGLTGHPFPRRGWQGEAP